MQNDHNGTSDAGEDPQPPQELALALPLEPYVDELYVPPLVRPAQATGATDEAGRLQMRMVAAQVKLHAQLANPTNVWTYCAAQAGGQGAEAPVGPTIEVRQNQRVLVEWTNALTNADGSFAAHPVIAVRDMPAYVQLAGSGETPGEVHAAENLLGFTQGKRDETVAHLPPWTVVHLHGGRTAADYDGWPETAYYPGHVQTTVYENRQPGALLWYHDHAMAITRLNVYAGLAGLYVIRDPLEEQLGLPRGAGDQELLLLVQDRALTCADEAPGVAGDQLLHKTGTPGGEALETEGGQGVDQAPMEFFGPLTLVNGRIWPRAHVRAGVYRLRILNGSSARTYRLRFTGGEGTPLALPMQMIGSDGGLLARPVDLNDASQHPEQGTITLMPAERVDVLVDFSAFSGQRLELRNFARSPFDGSDADPDNPLADFLPYPQVMCFDVGERSDRHRLLAPDQVLLPSAQAWPYAAVQRMKPVERLVALVEDDAGVLQLQECAPLRGSAEEIYWDGQSPLPVTQLALRRQGETRHRRYCLLRSMFSDEVRYLARDGDVEIWRLINLSGDSHPIHLHLVHFKLLAREPYSEVERLPEPSDEHAGGGYEIHFAADAEPILLDAAELGWKDTIRVDPAEMVTIAVPFRDYQATETEPQQGARLYMTGRYMYHCHILEHEDHEMMRPYVVMAPEAIDHMHGMGGHKHEGEGRVSPIEEGERPDGEMDAGWYMGAAFAC